MLLPLAGVEPATPLQAPRPQRGTSTNSITGAAGEEALESRGVAARLASAEKRVRKQGAGKPPAGAPEGPQGSGGLRRLSALANHQELAEGFVDERVSLSSLPRILLCIQR